MATIAPTAPATSHGAAAPATLRTIIELPAPADLRDLWELPNTTARRAEAVARMQAGLDEAIAREWPRLQRALPEGASASIVERLWIDNAVVADITLPEPGPAAVDQLHAALGWEALLVPAPASEPAPAYEPRGPGAMPPPTHPGWNLERLGAPQAWAAGHRGEGVRIGIVDSGVQVDHPELAGAFAGTAADGTQRLAGAYHDPRGGSEDGVPRITSGHGTWVAGLAVGESVGVAPGARFTASVQWGSDPSLDARQAEHLRRLDLLRGMQWMTAPPTGPGGAADAAAGAHLVNASWHAAKGTAAASDRFLDTALRQAAAAGVVTVAAAGNTGGRGWISYPGDLEEVIAVAGTDAADQPIPGQGRGPSRATDVTKPDVAAPETDLVSIRAAGGYQRTQQGGTSSSAPQVTGVLAIVDSALMAAGEAPVDVREARLVLGALATDAGEPGPDDATGMGVPDLRRLDAALDALRAHRGG